MGLDEIWKNFIKTGNIEYYIEYKKLQNVGEFKNANKNASVSNKSGERGGKRPPFDTFN